MNSTDPGKTGQPWKATLFLILLCSISSNATAADNIEKTGDALQILIPAIAYGTTFYLDDNEGRNQFYTSFAATLGITQILKYSIDKKRPNGSDRSFPSGHTSAAFQGASFIHKRYGLKFAIPAYIGASFVGYSRVESNNHYVEDVLAGAAIGIASSFYFSTPYKGFYLRPIAQNGAFGINVSAKW